jgi:transposase
MDANGRQSSQNENGMQNVGSWAGLIKIIWHDGQGMCLFAKRLERGRFIWPSASAGAVTITAAQLGYLFDYLY